jgi:hypothetical protein
LKRQLLFVGVLLLLSPSAQTEPVPLESDALKQTLAGRTVHLDTPLGIAVPITFQANGLMSGQAGVLAYILGAEADRGRWWVTEGKLCQKWFKWLDAQPSCMRLAQDGHKLFWRRDDGMSGTATIAATVPPGAETGPQGLGGPIETADLRQSLSAIQPPPIAKPANIAVSAASLPRTAKPTATKAAAFVVPAPVRQPARKDELGDHSRVADITNGATTNEQDCRWCVASASVDAIPGVPVVTPTLILVARLHYAPREIPLPSACLTTEPALRQVAKLGIHVRQSIAPSRPQDAQDSITLAAW